VAEPGKVTRYTRNGQGNITQQQWWSTADATGAQGFAAMTASPEQSRQTQYDAAQRPVRITQRSNGVVQQDWAYTYNGAGQLASVQDLLSGETASVGLHALGMPTQVSSSGAAAIFNWNAQGQLQSANHAGYSLSFQYDSRQWLSGIHLGGGRTIAISYDAQGQISQVQDNTGLANQPTEQAQGTQRLRRQALPLFLNPALTGGMAAAMPGAGGATAGGATAQSPWMRQAQCEVCNPLASTSVSPVVLQQVLQQNVVWAVLAASTVQAVAQGLVNELLTYRASTQLANNMQCRTDAYYQEKPDGPCTEPHHIVPYADGRFQAAIDARAILAEVGIDLNSAANGVWVECDRHRRMHNGDYYSALRLVLQSATPRNREEVTKALNIVRTGILNKTFPGTAF
jgi:YD repeat-containing protein